MVASPVTDRSEGPAFRAAGAADLAPILALLGAAGLPLDGVGEHIGSFRVGLVGRDLVTAAGVELYGPVGLVRSVVVAESGRGRGWGGAVMRDLLGAARERNVTELYLLTETATGFFTHLGYRPVSRDEAPEAIRRTGEFSTICPSSAVFMRLALGRPGDLCRRFRFPRRLP